MRKGENLLKIFLRQGKICLKKHKTGCILSVFTQQKTNYNGVVT